VVDWTIIDGAATGRRMGDAIVEAPRSFADRTSTPAHRPRGRAARALAYASGRRTIDVSGDGTNNAGRDVKLARDEALAKGISSTASSSSPIVQCVERRHTNPPEGSRNTTRQRHGRPRLVRDGSGGFPVVRQGIIKKMIAEIALLQMAPRIILR